MDFWESILDNSDCSFITPKDHRNFMATNQHIMSNTADSLLKEMETDKEFEHKGVLVSAKSSIPRISPCIEKSSDQKMLEACSKCRKIKTEAIVDSNKQLTPWTEKNNYHILLSEMRRMKMALSIIQGEKQGLADQLRNISELLQQVIEELDHSLNQALFEFSLSKSFEDRFWISVQAMANNFGVKFSDFTNLLERFCCFDSDIPGLEDQGNAEDPWTFMEHSIEEFAQEPKSFTSSQQNDPCTLPELVPFPTLHYPDMDSIAFDFPDKRIAQQFPFPHATTHVHSKIGELNFGPSPVPDVQVNPMSSFCFNQYDHNHLLSQPKTLLNSSLNSVHGPPVSLLGNKSTAFRIQDGTTASANTCENPSKDENIHHLVRVNQGSWKTIHLNNVEPNSHLNTPAATVRAARKRRMARLRRQPMAQHYTRTNLDSSVNSWYPSWPIKSLRSSSSKAQISKDNSSSAVVQNKFSEKDLQFLLQKELKPSDVGNLGRIILPKRQAEENLPHLDAKEGMNLSFEDIKTSCIWNLRFRFWPNNKTRMYLLESTGNFVKAHHLQEGDLIILYKNPTTGRYMISGKKAGSFKNSSKALKKSQETFFASSQNDCLVHFPPSLLQNANPVFETNTLLEKSSFLHDVNERQTDFLVCTTSTTENIDMIEEALIKEMEQEEDIIPQLPKLEANDMSIEEIFDFEK